MRMRRYFKRDDNLPFYNAYVGRIPVRYGVLSLNRPDLAA